MTLGFFKKAFACNPNRASGISSPAGGRGGRARQGQCHDSPHPNPSPAGEGIISACLGILALFSFFLLPPASSANTLTTERTQTSIISAVKTIHAGDKFWVALHIEMKPGWHTYWVNPGDSGIPPQLKWTLPNGFTAGPTQFIAPEREKLNSQVPIVDYAYDNDAYYLVSITPPSVLSAGMTSILALKASWLVCKDICIPENGELSLALPAADKAEPSDDAGLMAQLVNRLPVLYSGDVPFSASGGEIQFLWPPKGGASQKPFKQMLFFPQTDNAVDNAADQKVGQNSDGSFTLTLKQPQGAKAPDFIDGVLSIFYGDGKRADYALHMQSKKGAAVAEQVYAPEHVLGKPMPEQVGFIHAVLYALLGGLILNAMPCVFPVLSLKCLAVAKKAAGHPEEVRKQGLAYASGVIACFLLLAFALLAFKQGGQAIGWGYQLQSPAFVGFLAMILFLVGLNLAGYFDLPVLLGNVGTEATAKDTPWASFLTGALAVVVATPCTAPFMASAIGFALTQGAGVIFAVFVALGLGLASPFLLISFYPRLIRLLPKPGQWMNTFKELLSFPMFGWAVWLLWVLAQEAGAQASCIVLLGMILLAFALWLWRHGAAWVRVLAVLVLALALYTPVLGTQMPEPMPPSALQKANRYSAARLESLLNQGKPVFVDATADWCLICKVNEAVALSNPAVQQAFKDKGVTYMVADWTHYDADILHYLESFGRSGVPIYVYYPAGDGSPVVLPQVLTPSTVLGVLQ